MRNEKNIYRSWTATPKVCEMLLFLCDDWLNHLMCPEALLLAQQTTSGAREPHMRHSCNVGVGSCHRHVATAIRCPVQSFLPWRSGRSLVLLSGALGAFGCIPKENSKTQSSLIFWSADPPPGSEQKRPGANRPPEFVPESPLQKGSLGVIFSPRNYRENAHSKSANFEGRHSGGHLLGRPLLFTSDP